MKRLDPQETLSRTAMLVQNDFFPDLTTPVIVDGLRALRVRILADQSVATSVAGQTALVTSLVCLLQSGACVDIDVPDVPVIGSQPPLRSRRLAAGLQGLVEDQQGQRVLAGAPVDVEFAFGLVPLRTATERFYVTGGSWHCELGRDERPGPNGSGPFGGLLAGIAVGAEGFRTALRLTAERTDTSPLAEHPLERPDRVQFALAPLDGRFVDLGRVDFISAGAITNAAVFALLRVCGLRGCLRVLDSDVVAASNLNRYPLFSWRDLGKPKVNQLAAHATGSLAIVPEFARLEAATLGRLRPFAQRVAVGVDHIPSRWLAQRETSGWLAVAGTSHLEVVVSEHPPNWPCAGCLHPIDEPMDGEIPTVSFVSTAAGTLLAHRLLGNAYGLEPTPPTLAYPFNLAAPRGVSAIGLVPRRDCPVACEASRAVRPAASPVSVHPDDRCADGS